MPIWSPGCKGSLQRPIDSDAVADAHMEPFAGLHPQAPAHGAPRASTGRLPADALAALAARNHALLIGDDVGDGRLVPPVAQACCKEPRPVYAGSRGRMSHRRCLHWQIGSR